ncbi:hypothetical protein GCM10027277_01390 [Pseudoduganella ginsengisoli]|uniref:HPt domain-containing protein n=1 Tax=Pseudoduganella ginsengisoli TaxID=1462440 RepID=A0A6L6Q9D9_9BURK|nr:Hpt domain-containing protein [Pseudoduganella ginsengisoli]MTW06089.1 hypothetical protein [Pseudoduganella ginsengisoli]
MPPVPCFHHFAMQDLYVTACRDAAVSVRLLQLFISTTPATMQALERALNNGDRAQWRDASHAMKGTARLIGARRLSDLAADMERVGWQDTAIVPTGTANELRNEYAHVMREVAECASLGADLFQQAGAQ